MTSDRRLSSPVKTAARYRMIAIDLDGTLLSATGQVTPRTRAAVHAALAQGLLVCFATGRNWTESKTVLDAVGHYDTAVFVGGAMVVDTRKRITLHRMLMQPQLAAAVCGFMEARGLAAMALQEFEAAGVDYLVSADHPLNPTTERWIASTGGTLRRIPNLGHYRHEHTMRVSVVAPASSAAAVLADLTAMFGDRIFALSISVPTQGVDVIEIFDPAVNKWQGILQVAAHHGILPEQIIAIGDDMNDLPMIRNAGLGVAMGNARLEVRSAAQRVIGSNRDDGLARFLEELIAEHRVQPVEQDEVCDSHFPV